MFFKFFPMAIGLIASLALPVSALGDYVIRPGDVLAIDVAGVSGMQQRMPVDPNGKIRVPLIGPLAAQGKTIDEINSIVQTRLSATTLRQVSVQGEEYLVVFDPRQIMVSIAEYRPVYLTGDVARPGEQPFRPGMTVRQAIALAGGNQRLENLGTGSLLQGFDLKAEYITLWTQAMRERVRIAHLRSELAGADEEPDLETSGSPLPAATVKELADLESARTDVKRVDHTREIEFLRREIENSLSQLATVKEQQAKEREGLEADTAELERLQDLEKRGNTTSARVTDARRSLLLSSTRYLQATAQISQFGREQAELRRRLQKAQDDRKLAILEELQNAVVAAATTDERIKAVAEKLRYAGISPASILPSSEQERSITLVRNEGNGLVKITADEDTSLLPGDVIDIKLISDVPQPALALGN